MARSEGQKLKLLYIKQLLENESSEETPVSVARILDYLGQHGINAERKSIYDDMEKLGEFGVDVLKNSNRNGGGYYLGEREFELAELKLLVDAVQSSRFITEKKSRDLIAKLEAKAGKHDAGKLQRQVHVVGRVKTENEGIYYNIDALHRAIQDNCQISFVYNEWDLNKKLSPRDDLIRTVSPWLLIWANEYYYLAAYDAAAGKMKNYRVDKMGKVALLDQKREGEAQFKKIDPSAYTNQVFGMFGGETEKVTLEFPNKLIGVVIDRFGKDIHLRRCNNGTFRVHVSIAVSDQFFGWLTGIGKNAKIVGPEEVKAAYKKYLMDIIAEN